MLLALLLTVFTVGPQHGVIVPVPQGQGVHTITLYHWNAPVMGWWPLASKSVTTETEVRFDVAKHYDAPLSVGGSVSFYATAWNAAGESVPSEVITLEYPDGVWFCSTEFWSPSGGWCHQ